jgi:fatty-acyl-CoA synthase
VNGHLAGYLRFWGRLLPDRPAVLIGDTSLTWQQLDRRVDELAAGIHSAGVRPGDVVGILLSNRLEFVETMLAAFRLGATVALLNTRFTPSEMVYPIEDSGTTFVVTEAKLRPILADAENAVATLRVVSVDPELGVDALDDLRRPGDAPPARDLDPEEIALLAYTSGTTGVPKGTMLSHRAIVANATSRAVADGLSWRDHVLCILPLAFTGGASTYLREALCTGARVVIAETFEPEFVLELFERERITTCSAVPVMWQRILSWPGLDAVDLSHLRTGIAGGATMPIETIRGWQERGVGIRQGYGQTEFAGGYATLLYEHEAAERIGSVGRPVLHHEVRIADENDNELPVGEPGQILLRGASVMTGYWNKPEATAAALAGGWLHTGDIGVLDADGYLRLVDRARDVVISGGFNVYPAEVEKVLAGLPGLEECAVIGVPDEQWGEVPMLVVPDLAPVDLDALRAHIGERLADYRRPKWLFALDSPLPRTLGGKILKRDLRDQIRQVPSEAILLKASRANGASS